jgi:hypothetical protein
MECVKPEIVFDLNTRVKCRISKHLEVYCDLQCDGTSDYGIGKVLRITDNHLRCNTPSLAEDHKLYIHQSRTLKSLI